MCRSRSKLSERVSKELRHFFGRTSTVWKEEANSEVGAVCHNKLWVYQRAWGKRRFKGETEERCIQSSETTVLSHGDQLVRHWCVVVSCWADVFEEILLFLCVCVQSCDSCSLLWCLPPGSHAQGPPLYNFLGCVTVMGGTGVDSETTFLLWKIPHIFHLYEWTNE